MIKAADSLSPVFQRIFDHFQEAVGAFAVQDAVIEDERQVDHGPDGNGIITGSIGHHHGAFLHRARAQDAGLGLHDDGRGKERAAGAVIGQGKSAAFNLIGQELFAAGAP